MGDRAVDCARLESVCTERYRGFESPPIRFILALLLGIVIVLNSYYFPFTLRRVSTCKFCRTFTILALGNTPRKFAPG